MIYETKENCKDDILFSLRDGILLISQVMYLLEDFEKEEKYECCQGIIEAINEYKLELDKFEINGN